MRNMPRLVADFSETGGQFIHQNPEICGMGADGSKDITKHYHLEGGLASTSYNLLGTWYCYQAFDPQSFDGGYPD
jgi:hypothetical protein